MCGRFTLTLDVNDLKEIIGLEEVPKDYQPRFNIAPTQPVAVLTQYPNPQFEMMRWGLIPFWAKDPSIGNRLINARAETVAEKPAFRSAFASRRCLILADGFYEWQRTNGKKGTSRPYYFQAKDNPLFAFAGLWETWNTPDGKPLRSCTIITTQANEVVQPIHERMPVILPQERWVDWIETQGQEDLLLMLRPFPPERLDTFPVSPEVNNPAVDTPLCVKPWDGV